MSRLAKVFAHCRAEGRAALVGYLTAGDPDPETSGVLIHRLADEADIVEIGMPFSDPMADGPVIQAASERALAAGTHVDDVFSICAAVRRRHPRTGIVLMGYANVPFAMGFDAFAERAAAAGADGVLLVDIPPEERGLCDSALARHGLDHIPLLAPTSTEARIRLACENASGFVYYVSLTGITGAEMGAMDEIRQAVRRIRRHSTLPVCVGFGVKTPEQAAAVAGFADGVVVGSQFVSQIPAHAGERDAMVEAIGSLARAMREAIAASGSGGEGE
ncbi:MAG: tryptophan synthase subunit alpha [Mariprofundaceae bacterium]